MKFIAVFIFLFVAQCYARSIYDDTLEVGLSEHHVPSLAVEKENLQLGLDPMEKSHSKRSPGDNIKIIIVKAAEKRMKIADTQGF